MALKLLIVLITATNYFACLGMGQGTLLPPGMQELIVRVAELREEITGGPVMLRADGCLGEEGDNDKDSSPPQDENFAAYDDDEEYIGTTTDDGESISSVRKKKKSKRNASKNVRVRQRAHLRPVLPSPEDVANHYGSACQTLREYITWLILHHTEYEWGTAVSSRNIGAAWYGKELREKRHGSITNMMKRISEELHVPLPKPFGINLSPVAKAELVVYLTGCIQGLIINGAPLVIKCRRHAGEFRTSTDEKVGHTTIRRVALQIAKEMGITLESPM